MRLRFFTVILSINFFFTAFSQQIIVTEEFTYKPIHDVLVFHENKEHISYTDQRGMAVLSDFPEGAIYLQHPSYHQRTCKYTKEDLRVTMREKIISYNEVVVSANKWEQSEESISQQILSVNKKSIEFQNPQTSADLLAGTGQVFVQKSQLGGGSPKIRGFAANAVLLVVDGVRMNNAIFRSGNLQNVINIDPNALESSEVIFGPGSVIYGSDALGGVMDFHTISPKWSSDNIPDFSVNSLARYSSAAQERTGHLDFSYARNKFTFFHSTSFTAFDDLRAGGRRSGGYEGEFERNFYVQHIDGQDQLVRNVDVNLQKFSGYDLFNTISKIKFRLGQNVDIGYGYYYSTTSDIPRYDNLTETLRANTDSLANAEWYYGPQKWQMHNLRLNYYQSSPIFDQARLLLAYQNFEEIRNDRPFSDDRLRIRTETVDMYAASLDFDKEFKKSNLYYGIDFHHNEVGSEAFRRNIFSGEITEADSRYPDGGSKYTSLALYGSYINTLSKTVIINSGLRFSNVQLSAKTTSARALANNSADIDLNNSAMNGSVGSVINLSKTNRLSYNFSTGFRAPNVDDVGKVFEVGNRLTVPNPNLEPEYTVSNEIAYEHKTNPVYMKIVVFYSHLFDAIIDDSFPLNGSSTQIIDEDTLTIRSKVNTGEGVVYGGSMNIIAEFSNYWAITKTISYTGGRDITNDEPLRHTTPIFGKATLTYQRRKLRSEFYIEYNNNHNRNEIPSVEIDDKPYLYTNEGSPGWYTLNLKSSYRFNEKLNVNLGIENILDRHYRPASSGISAPGRNVIIALRANIL
ncbi:MAG: TonB-dependent receptor [Bacteroidota bacterium]